MLINIFINPFFWISIYLIGYLITIVVLALPKISRKVENEIPKFIVRLFTLLTFIAPIIALPFSQSPKINIPTSLAFTLGTILLILNFYIKILAQRQIGVIPTLKTKAKLVTTGIYGIVRHPLYLSNALLAIGMAVLLKSMFALLCSIPYLLLFLPIIYFEEKNLLEKYGQDYKEYKRKVCWRMIPKLF